MFNDLDPTQKKVLFIGGGLLLAVFVFVKMRGGASSSTASTSTTADGSVGASSSDIANLQSQIDQLQMSAPGSSYATTGGYTGDITSQIPSGGVSQTSGIPAPSTIVPNPPVQSAPAPSNMSPSPVTTVPTGNTTSSVTNGAHTSPPVTPSLAVHQAATSAFGVFAGTGKAADVMNGDSVYTRYQGTTKINTVLNSAGQVVAVYDHPAQTSAPKAAPVVTHPLSVHHAPAVTHTAAPARKAPVQVSHGNRITAG